MIINQVQFSVPLWKSIKSYNNTKQFSQIYKTLWLSNFKKVSTGNPVLNTKFLILF